VDSFSHLEQGVDNPSISPKRASHTRESDRFSRAGREQAAEPFVSSSDDGRRERCEFEVFGCSCGHLRHRLIHSLGLLPQEAVASREG